MKGQGTMDKKKRKLRFKEDEGEADHEIPQNKKKGSIKKHQDELSGLKDADPEFYEYLKENDAGLLDFAGDGDEDEEEEDDLDLDGDLDSEDDDEDGERSSSVIDVNAAILEATWKKATTSRTGLKQLLAIFTAACNPSFNNDDEEGEKKFSRYTISSAAVYDKVMSTVIDQVYTVFNKMLDIDPTDPDTIAKIESHPRWKNTKILVLLFFKSYHSTLSSLLETFKQGEVSSYLINNLEHYIPLLAALPRFSRQILKVLLGFWSKEINISEDSDNLRALSFLRIRQMALQLPGATREECFRSIYLTFARSCKSYSEQSSENVVFMAQCVTELYKLDPVIAYQQGFLYIRQLSLHLRNALLKKTSEALRQVTTWQFVNCYRLWTRIICALPAQDELGALAFPLTQVAFGLMSIATSVYYLPLRYHLIACLQQLAACVKVFIPIAPRVIEVLDHPDLSSKATPSTDVRPNWNYLLKLPPDSISKAVYRDVIIEETVSLIRNDAEIYRFNPGSPEYMFLTIRKLKNFVKNCKIGKWRDVIKTIVGQLEQYASFAKKKRSELDKTTLVSSAFESLLTAGNPIAKQRLAKLLTMQSPDNANEITVQAFNTPRPGATKKSRNDDDDDEEDDDSMEVDSDDEDEDEDDEDEEEEIVKPNKNNKAVSNKNQNNKKTDNKNNNNKKNDKNNNNNTSKDNKNKSNGKKSQRDDHEDEVAPFEWSEDEDN